jgi:hypothetical protein
MATANKGAGKGTTKDTKKKSKAVVGGAAPALAAVGDTKPVKAAASNDAKAEKADKPKKPKLVRDSFTIPKTEYAVLEELKLRAAKLGRPTKKSEVLRAGVQALAAMGDAAFLATVSAVPAVKTGRPAKA